MISYAARFAHWAAEHPHAPALTDEDGTVTWRELVERVERAAVAFAAVGVEPGDTITIALPNSVAFVAAAMACWRVGAVPQPVSSRLPQRERDAIVDLADPKIVVGAEPGAYPGRVCLAEDWSPPAVASLGALPAPEDVVSRPWKAMTSGGSTGRPKLILAGGPGTVDPDVRPSFLISEGGCMVMPGPLYHNGPFVWAVQALLAGNHLVVLRRFDAAGTLEMIERHRADLLYVVPTMMLRIWRLPDDVRERFDVSSLRAVWHLAAPCPPWLKEAWIGWLGPQVIWELYGGTEAQATTIINGVEWLEHRGSVGRPYSGEIKIVGPDGGTLAPGEVGEVFMRPGGGAEPTYRYVGAEARRIDGGWESLGDMGSMDEDGYLYLADRKTDMVLVGGANVYPAEIEAALDEHPRVQSCAVVGLPDEDLGNRLHAIVHADGGTIAVDELRDHLAERLVVYKIPRTFEFVDEPVRDDAGKVRRTALRDERSAPV